MTPHAALHVVPHVPVHVPHSDKDKDIEADKEASSQALANKAEAIRSLAEQIVERPVMGSAVIEGLARLPVPLNLLLDKMRELGTKAALKGKPIGSIHYFKAPLEEFAEWHQRRQMAPAVSPSMSIPNRDWITQAEHAEVIAELRTRTSPETQRRIDTILTLEPRPRWQAQWALHSEKLSPEAFDKHIERYRATCSAAS